MATPCSCDDVADTGRQSTGRHARHACVQASVQTRALIRVVQGVVLPRRVWCAAASSSAPSTRQRRRARPPSAPSGSGPASSGRGRSQGGGPGEAETEIYTTCYLSTRYSHAPGHQRGSWRTDRPLPSWSWPRFLGDLVKKALRIRLPGHRRTMPRPSRARSND